MGNAFFESLRIGAKLCRFKRSAADMPHANEQHKILLVIYGVLYSALMVWLQNTTVSALAEIIQNSPELQEAGYDQLIGRPMDGFQSFVINFIQFVVLGGVFYGFLMTQDKTARFDQSFLALVVTNFIYALIFSAILLIGMGSGSMNIGMLGMLIVAVLALCNIAVLVRIIAQTFDTSILAALAIFIALQVASAMLSLTLISAFFSGAMA